MKTIKTLLIVAVLGGVGALGFVYSGVYHIGANTPHTDPVYWVLETLRERSIAARSSAIEVPPLNDPKMLLSGGADYNDMCAGCHLKPGVTESDLSIGLYPTPPNLAQAAAEHGHGEHNHGDESAAAARQFWIIKNGIKASGMPAWGATHDDDRMWAMVAFLQKLPELTPAQYQVLTARGAPAKAMHEMQPQSEPAPEIESGHHGKHAH